MPSEAAADAPPVWHGLLAGSVAGASGVLIGHAFDTAKVHAQIGGTPGRLKAVQLYRGIVPPLLTTGCVRSLYFGVYEKCKQRVDDSLPSTSPTKRNSAGRSPEGTLQSCRLSRCCWRLPVARPRVQRSSSPR